MRLAMRRPDQARVSLVLLCAVAFLTCAAVSYTVTAAVEEPQYAWLHGFDARGRQITLGSLRGQVVAVTFVGRKTRDEATDINEDLARLAEPGRMTVISVVDLEDVPHFGHKSALQKIAESDRPGLVHLVDDDGRLKQAFSVEPARQVSILVLDRDGAVRGRFEGEAGLPAALKLIEKLKAT
jgi:hypothetical protein